VKVVQIPPVVTAATAAVAVAVAVAVTACLISTILLDPRCTAITSRHQHRITDIGLLTY
jgi:hypothetical protein